MAVLRRGVPVLHAICAVAGAVFGAARNGAGAGDLVGKAAGVDFEDSGDDGTSSQRVPVGGGAAELRGRGMSGGSSAATNVSICGRSTSFIGFVLECWNTFEPKRKLGRADGYFTAEFTGPHPPGVFAKESTIN